MLAQEGGSGESACISRYYFEPGGDGLEECGMNVIPSKCPVCGGELIVTRLHCPACETSLEGSFAPGASPLQEAFKPEQLRSLLPFARLTQEQLYFVLTFVRCEGRFNRMEEELNLSYPTLRNRLDEIIRALGFEPAREEPARQEPLLVVGPAERQAILDQLNRGEISVEEARRRLRGEQPEPAQKDQSEPAQKD